MECIVAFGQDGGIYDHYLALICLVLGVGNICDPCVIRCIIFLMYFLNPLNVTKNYGYSGTEE